MDTIYPTLPLDQLKSLNEVRNTLMQCQGVDEVVQEVLKQVRNKLNVQVASIFLISKDGVIKRVGINGIDKHGNSINNTWFSEDEYKAGRSFSGKAIPKPGSELDFGEPNWCNNLEDYPMDEATKTPYKKKLGDLRCGVSVPISGRSRTFGTLEVLNKIDQSVFSIEDVYWLMLITTIIANCISDFTNRSKLSILEELNQKLIDIEVIEFVDRYFNLQQIYNWVVEKICTDFTPYKACILRITNENEDLIFKAKFGINISWEKLRLDVPKKADSGVVREVWNRQEPIFIEDINTNLNQFYNKEWIKLNNLNSYAFVPLLVKGKIFGTISIFIGYHYKFSENDKTFLKNISFLTAAIIAITRIKSDLTNVRRELDEERYKILSASVAIGYDSLLQGFLHQYKKELRDLFESLKTIYYDDSVSKKEKNQILNDKIRFIERRVEEIQDDFAPDEPVAININEIIRSIAKIFSFELKEKGIEIILQCSDNIPIIELNETKIKDVIFNLLSNAVVAIDKDNRKNGKILVTTSVITPTSDVVQYIQVVVEDNGIGIRNENKGRIFDKGFTTRKNEGGTGMGLFIAHKIIDNYGGKIEYDSRFGKGTKFIITIPIF